MSYSFYITPEEYEIAEKNGIKKNTLEVRVRRQGWSIKRAITTPVIRGKYDDLKVLANKHGIPFNNIRARIHHGWGPEKAATEPVKNQADHIRELGEKKRKYPKELIELAEQNGISYDTFKQRVIAGWDMNDASTKPLVSGSERGRNRVKKLREMGFKV